MLVSPNRLFTLDFGTTVPPLTEFIKNLLGKYTEGQILKVSGAQYQYHTVYHACNSNNNHVDQVLSTTFCFNAVFYRK